MESRRARWAWGALTGVAAGAVAIGVAQLAAGILRPTASPVITVGQAAIDATPEWLKSWAIRTFGSNDKTVLLLGIGAVLAILSIVLGIVSIRRPGVAMAGLVGFGILGIAAALSRPAAELSDALPPIAGVLAAAFALRALHRMVSPAEGGREPASEPPVLALGELDRRRFFLTAAGAIGLAAVGGGVGTLLGRRFRADASRAGVHIPEPVSTASASAGVDLSVPNVGPFFTPNARFYRVDTALLVPSVMAEDWQLRVHGMVDREVTLDYPLLLERPLIERDVTLTCVSNEVGGRYAGNARWIGAPLKDLLEEAGVQAGADQIVSRSIDGFTCGSPTAVVMDGRDAMLAVAMNGEPLPLAHGFPVRMVVPGLYGYVSATKWVVDIELSTFDAFDAYWIKRGWAQQAPIKTQSRIDTPDGRLPLEAGEVVVAGVAWAQHTGIAAVEVQVDDGPWSEAELGAEDTIDTWRQWVYRWQATPGDHLLRVRATDRSGYSQTADRAEPFPDGAEGWHTIQVHVS
jgi:DMSO/TMAO reductase YedYZ molybdopterin-dependent catalytic subunit